MGLNDFKTESSSSSSSESKSDKTKKVTVSDDSEEERPYFTAVLDLDLENITTHKGKSAFPRSARYKRERIIKIIQNEEDFKRLTKLASQHHGKDLEQLFKHNPSLAKDFVERLSEASGLTDEPECPVCGSDIDVKNDEYTTVDGTPVHGGHDILKVVKALEIGEYES